MKRIVIIRDYAGYLRQNLSPKITIDTDCLIKEFKTDGYEVLEYSYDELINKEVSINNSLVLYTSSQRLEYKEYINDILFDLAKNNTLIPRFEIFKAHENKGYQEVLKKERNIKSLKTLYLATDTDFCKYDENIQYPVIFKRLSGAGSSNVYKANNKQEVLKLIKKFNKPDKYLTFIVKKFLKTHLYKQYAEYSKESTFVGRYILQEFIPNLKDDWKVLVFGEKYYVLNRKVRKNDFRASGSGKLGFIDPPEGLLDYAREIYLKLDVPFVSLDICFDGNDFHLIEFQGTHFGPYTIVESPHYYTKNENVWKKKFGKSDLANEFAKSIKTYVENKRE